ncbi:DUF6886 family protein [Lysinibacillus sp. NPDC097231]|uniref:DUF6886 family protein n=1 Tax=Lysinibacillus sp. NPDC097231 TaxID=3364142 RepID=UPI003823552E
MRLFHVSEESDISVFYPRIPNRPDLDATTGLVWAITETCLPNFLTPRNCPRVCYHVGVDTTEQDKRGYIASCSHVVVIESKWFETMKNTKLYLYEFAIEEFTLQDDIAGYYTSKTTQFPIAKIEVENLFQELFNRNTELRVVDNLWDIYDEIQKTSLRWSMCRMQFAQPRKI